MFSMKKKAMKSSSLTTLIRNLDYNAMLKLRSLGHSDQYKKAEWFFRSPHCLLDQFSPVYDLILPASIIQCVFTLLSLIRYWKINSLPKIIWWFIDVSLTLSSPFTCLIFGKLATAVSMRAHPKLKLSIKAMMRWWTELLESNWSLEDIQLFIFEGMLMNLVLYSQWNRGERKPPKHILFVPFVDVLWE